MSPFVLRNQYILYMYVLAWHIALPGLLAAFWYLCRSVCPQSLALWAQHLAGRISTDTRCAAYRWEQTTGANNSVKRHTKHNLNKRFNRCPSDRKELRTYAWRMYAHIRLRCALGNYVRSSCKNSRIYCPSALFKCFFFSPYRTICIQIYSYVHPVFGSDKLLGVGYIDRRVLR